MQMQAPPECLGPLGVSLRVLRAVALGVGIAVLVGNACILSALWYRRRRHEAHSYLFVLNLAACGLLGGLTEVFGMATEASCDDLLFFSSEETLCKVEVLVFVFGYVLNVTALGLVALDRYIFILYSLRYMQLVTRRRAVAMIGTTWIFSGLCAVSVLIDNNYWKGDMLCRPQSIIPAWHLIAVEVPLNVLMLVLVTAANWRMRSEARRNEKLHCVLNGQSTSGGEWDVFSAKSARVTAQVVLCYVLAFTPIQVVFILDVYDVGSDEARGTASYFCAPVFTLSYLINPLLYTWKNAHLRADLHVTWKIVRAFWRRVVPCSNLTKMHTVRS